jgi:hypothetical protein
MAFNKEKYDQILSRGLCKGLSDADDVCIEGAIALASGEKLNHSPKCVARVLHGLGIQMNDLTVWASRESRAKGLYKFGLAQVGTRDSTTDKDKIDTNQFLAKLDGYIVSKAVVDCVVHAFHNVPEVLKLVRDSFVGKSAEIFDRLIKAVISANCDQKTVDIINCLATSLDAGRYDAVALQLYALLKHRYSQAGISQEFYIKYILKLARRVLAELGHSNEFDSIWKEEK